MKSSLSLSIKLLGGILPAWGRHEDAGLDLYAKEAQTIPSGVTAKIPLGIATEFSSLFVGIVKDRSSLAAKGISVKAGVIDSGYRGEWVLVVRNNGEEWAIRRGDKVAQVIFVPCNHLVIGEVSSLSDSKRGVKGFGSTG